MGGEEFDLSALSGVYGPMTLSDRTSVPAMAAGLYTTKQSVYICVYTHTHKRNNIYICLF